MGNILGRKQAAAQISRGNQAAVQVARPVLNVTAAYGAGLQSPIRFLEDVTRFYGNRSSNSGGY